MTEATRVLQKIHDGDEGAADELLPLVYAELRKLAAILVAKEKPGQTIQATALVHDAYVRLVGPEQSKVWNSRGHFFAAAARAMRRLLVENARRKGTLKRGGNMPTYDAYAVDLACPELDADLLDLDAAMDALERDAPQAAQVVEYRYFSGLSVAQTAEVMSISQRSTERLWTYAKAFLHREIRLR